MKYDWKKIGRRIQKERKLLGLSQDAFCAKVGFVQRTTLSNWETGKSGEITVGMLTALCEVFDCDIGYLLCEYDCKTRQTEDIKQTLGLSERAINNLRVLYDGYCDFAISSKSDDELEIPDNVDIYETIKTPEDFYSYYANKDIADRELKQYKAEIAYWVYTTISDILNNLDDDTTNSPFRKFAEQFCYLKEDCENQVAISNLDYELKVFLAQKYLFEYIKNLTVLWRKSGKSINYLFGENQHG